MWGGGVDGGEATTGHEMLRRIEAWGVAFLEGWTVGLGWGEDERLGGGLGLPVEPSRNEILSQHLVSVRLACFCVPAAHCRLGYRWPEQL